MGNREEHQNRFLQPIQDTDRHGKRNSRVFLKAKVIQWSSSQEPNPDGDKIFSSSDHPAPNLNFGKTDFLAQFRLGAQEDLIPNINSLNNCFGENALTFPQPISVSSGFNFLEIRLQIFLRDNLAQISRVTIETHSKSVFWGVRTFGPSIWSSWDQRCQFIRVLRNLRPSAAYRTNFTS